MKKKWLAVLMMGTMLAGLTACGKSGGSNQAGGDKTVDTSEHVVITYMTTGDKPTGTEARYEEMMTELNKILTEKVNAELDIYFIPWTDYLSNYNLTLAQMDGTVDLVGTASDWLDAWPNAKTGAFLELSEDMLKTYAPKTWRAFPQNIGTSANITVIFI